MYMGISSICSTVRPSSYFICSLIYATPVLLGWSMCLKLMDSLIGNLPGDRDVAVVASAASRELIEDTVAEIQTGGAGGLPCGGIGRSGAATLATITDEEWEIRCLSVDSDNNLLAAVLVQVFTELGVIHSDDIVRVDVVEGLAGLGATPHNTHVLVFKIGAAGLHLFHIIVVGTESLSAENGGGTSRAGEEQTSCCEELSLHVVFGVL